MFRDRKVAQIAAFFLSKAAEARLPLLKLMKLLYLADREAIREYGDPMSNDFAVAMPHGPVLSMTFDLINGCTQSSPGGWSDYISDRENHDVSLMRPVNISELDELSLAECDILERIWTQYGGMNKWALRDWTHNNCPEWQDPQGSSHPIPVARIASAVGYTKEQSEDISAHIAEEQYIDRLFASL
jgi:uncharacterized phage-associated protein